jgi:pyruvate/2-oxoglutarate/acetoin dehydrogenase E1 component
METFEELKGHIALSCGNGMDARGLIFAADNAVRGNVPAVLCNLDSVNMLWTWLEKSNIKIFARVIAEEFDNDVQKIVVAIHSVFKRGANGVHLIASPDMHEKLAAALSPIAADLFFCRELILVMDLKEVSPSDYSGIFNSMKKTSAAGLGLIVQSSEETTAAFYGIIDSADIDFQYSLHIISKDSDSQTIENIWRLIKKMCPELKPSTVFFIEQQ